MELKVHLLFFEDCPNVEETRRNLRLALCEAGREPRWEEVRLDTSQAPDRWSGFPSPTVLINGADVATGAEAATGPSSCRFGQAPSVEILSSRLGKPDSRSLLASLAAVPAALLGALPVMSCGACYPALAGLLSALGLGALVSQAVFKPVMAGLLLIAVLGLLYRARRSRKYIPLALGSAGAAGIYASTFIISSSPVKAASITLLLSASILNVIPMLGKKGICPSCQP